MKTNGTGETGVQRIVEELEQGRRIHNRAEYIWGWGGSAGRHRAKRRAEMIIKITQMNSGRKILELGCGVGVFTSYFALTGAEITAIDVSSQLLSRAQESVKQGNVRFYLANILNLPFADNSFDSVVGVSILHHIDLAKVLSEIHRVLKPQGYIAFSEPNMLNPQIVVQKNIPFVKRLLGDVQSERAFLRWQLRKLLQICKFKEVKIMPFDFVHPFTPDFLLPFFVSVGEGLEKIGFIREIAGSLFITGCLSDKTI